jgi:hypothetical protein
VTDEIDRGIVGLECFELAHEPGEIGVGRRRERVGERGPKAGRGETGDAGDASLAQRCVEGLPDHVGLGIAMDENNVRARGRLHGEILHDSVAEVHLRLRERSATSLAVAFPTETVSASHSQ